MPEAAGYESHLSREAVAFVMVLSKKKQRLVLDLADQIALHPSRIGDYQTFDAVGRPIKTCDSRVIFFRTGWTMRVAKSESARLQK